MGNVLSICLRSLLCCCLSKANPRNFNSLPLELYHYLFDYLDLDDIYTFRLVNKKFYQIAKSYDIKELSFINHRSDYYIYYVYKDNWFTTTRSTKRRYFFDFIKLSMLKNPTSNILNIKFLRIRGSQPYSSFKIEDLNKFTKLQILMIDIANDCLKPFNGRLNFPELKALSIKFYHKESDVLVLNAPNLHSLDICEFSSNLSVINSAIKFMQPWSITYLKIRKYEPNMTIFSNLEVLEFFDCFDVNLEIENLFSLEKLKKLCVNSQEAGNANVRKTDKLKQLVGKKDLDMILNGVKIKSEDKIKEYQSNEKFSLDYQLNNYDELEDDLNFVHYICIGNRIFGLDFNLFPNLFKKYTNIQKALITTIDIQDWNRFVYFIEKCPNLYLLEVNGSFEQEFYEKIPLVSSLSILTIYENGNKRLNVDFIMKMPFLIYLSSSGDILISENLNLDDLKYFKSFRFEVKEAEIKIQKSCKGKFVIKDSERLGLPYQECLDVNELIKWTNYLREKE